MEVNWITCWYQIRIKFQDRLWFISLIIGIRGWWCHYPDSMTPDHGEGPNKGRFCHWLIALSVS